MGNDNSSIIRKAAIQTTSLSNGGLLNPEQARKFLQQTFEATNLGPLVRHEMRTAKTGEVDKIGIARRILRKKTENTDDGYRAGVKTSQIEYATTAVRLPWEITEETLRENIEGQNLEAIITNLMTTQLGIDLEDLYLNSDEDTGDAEAFSATGTYAAGDFVTYSGGLYRFTTAHAAGAWTGTDVEEIGEQDDTDFLKVNDGWIKQLKNGGHVHDALDAGVVRGDLDTAQFLLAVAQRHADRGAGRGPGGEAQRDVHAGARHVELPVEAGHMLLRHGLQPYAAPDAGGAVVPDAVRLLAPVLLAARQLRIVRVIERADHHDVLVRVVQQVRDVAGEGRLPAHVVAGEVPVHPHMRLMVHRAQVQQGAAPGAGHGGERAPVPDDGVKTGVVDAGGLRLGHEGHLDLAVEGSRVRGDEPALGEAAAMIVMREGPGPVQALPVLAHESGAGVGAVVLGGAQGHRRSSWVGFVVRW